MFSVAQLRIELGDRASCFYCLVGRDEEVDIGAKTLSVGEAATDEHAEANFVAVRSWPQTNVVDLNARAILSATGDGYFEFSRKVRVLTITGKEI